ncbi:MAG TPA: hypothetical protein VFN11_01060 [Ktedonobacterales bacterium]|nr:hypothetical protein [Ktedonobacterales bacterium]
MDEQTTPQADSQATNVPEAQAATPADGDGFHELALALIMERYPEATEGTAPQLLPGQLPPGFIGDFPLPPDTRVVGSLVAIRPTVVLDTGQSAEEVVAFYTAKLAKAGWETPGEMPPRQGGFLHSGPHGGAMRHSSVFYRGDRPNLHVMAYNAPGGRTTVHLSVLPNHGGPMRRGPHGRGMHYDIFSLLPPIAPPPNSQQFQEGGGGGNDRVTTSARVESDLDLASLAAHYTAQLEQGGWQRTNSGESDPVAWSTWNFDDEDREPWRALVIVLRRPDLPRHYWVHILAEWAGEQPQSDTSIVSSIYTSGGWFSYGAITHHGA